MAIYPAPKTNLVIFCGAGFSAPIGIPTMDQFPDHLRRSGFLSPQEQADLDLVQTTCNALASTIGGSARNLEQLASFLSILQLTDPGFEFAGATQKMRTPQQATQKLQECMAFLVRPDLDGRHLGGTASLMELATHANLTFITTNYDVHIELAAVRSNLRVRTRPEGVRLAGTSGHHDLAPIYGTASDPGIDLYKLHGSVNWIRDSDSDAVHAHGHAHVQARLDGPGRPPVRFCLDRFWNDGDRSQTAVRCRTDRCVIVPPTVLKPSMFDSEETAVLRDQWSGAARALADADMLWFIGYSFPESDSFMRFFLGASVFRNPRLKQIVVIDPDPDVIESRARPLLALPHHQDIFHSVPLGWESLDFGQLFNGNWRLAVSDDALFHLRKQLDRQSLLAGVLSGADEQRTPQSGRGRGRGRG